MRLRGKKMTEEMLQRLSGLMVDEAESYKGRWAEWFGNNRPIHVELGMGKGKFISEMSVLHPDVNFIGVDMYDTLIHRAVEKAFVVWKEAHGTAPMNIALVRMNIEHIEKVFADSEVERIYLNFSDPWPKKRHAKRRLTHPEFLKKYLQLLNERGEIHFKTDSRQLFEFSLNAFSDMGLRMRNISLDLHAEGPAANNVMTEYESKFFDQGVNIHRCEVIVGERALQEHVHKLREILRKY
ncbi:tRNA (guanosine(46)-N7)-methyltransferase TrmB [Ferviditalea candida]|uniref:tRNA (guanine-N(7)-)-methyltransferase n=1 Tax=Ferviditalea candida TaxID=3108399 RepID=A0ABU5ZIV6_9BACL|nr:tRNA (guanosine(46)-N7)-methyltransferase TrmB [Paenibacillaceae bacterium T2]